MKFGEDLRIKTATSWLPPDYETVEDAVATGKLAASDAERIGVDQLPVSARWSGPEMGLEAARAALARADWSPSRVGLVLHTWIYHQGHDMWSPPHFVASRLGTPDALAYAVQQGCNGGAQALQVAAMHLAADPGIGAVLVTTGDRFQPPGFERWNCDYNLGFGDAGSAALLHLSNGEPDDYPLVSLASGTDADLELMLRHGDEFSPTPLWHSSYIDLKRPKKSYLKEYGKEQFGKIAATMIRQVVVDSIHDAGLEIDDPRIKYIALPRLGDFLLDGIYLPVLTDALKAEQLRFGAKTGHLGCGDFLSNLADLRDRVPLEPGDHALVVSGGAAWTWTSAVVRVPERGE